jgi:hypothetical protein
LITAHSCPVVDGAITGHESMAVRHPRSADLAERQRLVIGPAVRSTAILTQRLELRGDLAAAFVDEIEAFETKLEPRMREIARTVERALL